MTDHRTPETIACNCATIPPTMPTYRTHHLPICPVWAFENRANVVGEVKEAAVLRTSNEQNYRDALEWYKERAESIARYLSQKQTCAVMAVVTELSLDMGARARRALSRLPAQSAHETTSEWLTDKQCDDVIAFLEDYEWTGLTRENVRTWCTAIAEAKQSENGTTEQG